MKRFSFVAIICCFAFVGLAITPRAKADEMNKKTIMTFNEPVEVPGVGAQILPAGTYVFTLVDSISDRNIVRITSEDGTHVYTTILAINNYRLKPTDKTVLTFKERGEGQPEAIKAWFYPGNNFGQEFVYPKTRAVELAKVVNEPVLEMPIENTEAVPVESLKTVPVAAVNPTGEEVAETDVVETPPATGEAVATTDAVKTTPATDEGALTAQAEPEKTLPHTASSMPLFALIGLLSLCAGFTLLIVMKRTA